MREFRDAGVLAFLILLSVVVMLFVFLMFKVYHMDGRLGVISERSHIHYSGTAAKYHRHPQEQCP